MPRPKSDKTNYAPLHPKVKLYVPDLPLVYKAKKVYMLLQRIEKAQKDDPLVVPIKDYLFLVSQYEEVSQKLIDRGWNTSDGRAKARMEQKKLDKPGNAKHSSGVGEEITTGVDDGVSATNPFA